MWKLLKNRIVSGIQTQKRLAHKIGRRDSTLDLWEELCKRACERSADYVQNNMQEVVFYVDDKQEFQKKSFQSRVRDGLICEFGCFRGESLAVFDKLTEQPIHGFDSFKGLPFDWHGHNLDASAFDTPTMVDLSKKIFLHKGLFSETLPVFLKEQEEDFSFIHIDCDIYSSTKDIFDIAGDRINPGCIIVFDEYINYPSWEQHEFKAFQEFIKSRGDLSYRYTKLCSIGATYNPGSVCVEITTETKE